MLTSNPFKKLPKNHAKKSYQQKVTDFLHFFQRILTQHKLLRFMILNRIFGGNFLLTLNLKSDETAEKNEKRIL